MRMSKMGWSDVEAACDVAKTTSCGEHWGFVGQYHFYICGTKNSRLFLNFSGFGIVLMVRHLAQVQTELGRHTSSGSCPGGSLNGALLELGLVCPIDGSKIQALKLPNLM